MSTKVCEKCGAGMVIKWGRNGQFLACSNYPECKNTKNFKKNEEGKVEAVEEVVESFWHLDGRIFRTLRDLLAEQGPLALEQALPILAQLAGALVTRARTISLAAVTACSLRRRTTRTRATSSRMLNGLVT